MNGVSANSFPSDVDPRTEIELLRRSLHRESPDFVPLLDCFRRYVFQQEGAWVLDASFVQMTRTILLQKQVENRTRLLRLFGHCAIRNDFVGLFSCRDKSVLNHVQNISTLDSDEQNAILLFLCNFSSHAEGRNILWYLSKWTSVDGSDTCNGRLVSQVAMFGLSSYNAMAKKYSIALIFNLSRKALFQNTVSVEILQEYKDIATELRQRLEPLLKSKKLTPIQESQCVTAIKNLSFE